MRIGMPTAGVVTARACLLSSPTVCNIQSCQRGILGEQAIARVTENIARQEARANLEELVVILVGVVDLPLSAVHLQNKPQVRDAKTSCSMPSSGDPQIRIDCLDLPGSLPSSSMRTLRLPTCTTNKTGQLRGSAGNLQTLKLSRSAAVLLDKWWAADIAKLQQATVHPMAQHGGVRSGVY